MQTDSETGTLLATTTHGTVTQDCRRCASPFSCKSMTVLGSVWPVTFYCERCYDAARAEHDAAEREAYRAKRARAWDDDVGRDAFNDTDTALLDPQKVARVMAWKLSPKGVLLHGASGKTKSRLMFMLARRVYVDDGVQVHVTRATAAARKVSEMNATPGFVESYIRSLITAPVLFIDDLGKETQSDKWESALVEVLDARGAARRPVVVTTNYVGDKLVERYRDRSTGEAVVRRLREFCQPIAFQ